MEEPADLRKRSGSAGSSFSMLPDVLPNVTENLAWANDNKTLFYNVLDSAKRPYKIFRHSLGTDAKADVEVFHEPEATVVWSASHQFAFGRPVSAVGEQPVDQHGENEVGEHVHGGLPEHGSPASAYL